MHIGALNIADKIDEAAFASLLTRISPGRQGRIKSFMFDKDKKRCLFGELLAQAMVKKFYNVTADFYALPTGKPVLAGEPNVHFNISHSGDWVVCVVDDKEVGIDVEQVRGFPYSISGRFFCAKEHDDIMIAEDPAQKFFEYWTLKESYVKFVGVGLARPLNQFCIEFLNGGVRVSVDEVVLNGVYFKQYEIGDRYKMAVCAGQERFGECRVYGVGEVSGPLL